MIANGLRFCLAGVLLPLLVGVSVPALAGENPGTTIQCPESSEPCVALAAREVRRYVYLRTGRVLPIAAAPTGTTDVIAVAVDSGLAPQAFHVETTEREGRRVLTLAGGSGVATLYAAYRFAEHLGIRFHLHGDVVPDEQVADWRVPRLAESHAPLFELRGIQPFHDFTEGPDWWNADDYKAHLSQAVKLRMNFLGLHCYPEGHAGPEPTVWLGLPGDVLPDGRVSFSYPSRYASTEGGAWGYDAMPTGEFSAGAAQLFDADSHGPEVTGGHRPMPADPAGCNTVFDRTGEMLRAAFTHARQRGIRICVGTETPLTIPAPLRERIRQAGHDPASPQAVREVYRGTFQRIQRTYPIDYYWLWTPENWTWSGASESDVAATMRDIELARAALADVGADFGLATCGWVLGPPTDRVAFDKQFSKSVALSCINREVGFTPVEPGFAVIDGRPKWAIPWLEDDPAMIIPQLWAGRMRRDAADALAYSCTGLLGIHWRTRILGPNIAALAQAAWDQRGWNPDFGKALEPPKVLTTDVHVGGNTADFGDRVAVESADDCAYRTCRWNLDAYRIAVPDGTYTVTLKFCEGHYTEPGRRVFGVALEGEQVAEGIDTFARVGANAPLDLTFRDVTVSDGELLVAFTREVEYPFIGGIVVEGRAAGDDAPRPIMRRINCGGSACGGFEADLPPVNSIPELENRPRDLPVDDFYLDWATAEFGPESAEPLARLFVSLDGGPRSHGAERLAHLPRPSNWDRGPGGIIPNRTPWAQERARYAFVDRLAELRPRVRGAGAQARFDYWLESMRYLRCVGELSCVRGQLDATMERIAAEQDPPRRAETALKGALPLRFRLSRLWEQMMTHLLATVSTPGELGTIANLEQHVRRHNAFLNLHDEKLAEALAVPLPDDLEPSRDYGGAPRLIVPTVRPDARRGEVLGIRAIVLARQAPQQVLLRWRPMGGASFREIALGHVARGVYTADLPAMTDDDVEYYITAKLPDGVELAWPPAAPRICQTVVVAPQTMQ